MVRRGKNWCHWCPCGAGKTLIYYSIEKGYYCEECENFYTREEYKAFKKEITAKNPIYKNINGKYVKTGYEE